MAHPALAASRERAESWLPWSVDLQDSLSHRLRSSANIYWSFADTVHRVMPGETPDAPDLEFPEYDDGLRGMLFIETVLASAKSSDTWTTEAA